MELSSITLFGFPVIWIVVGWIVVAFAVNIFLWLFNIVSEEWYEAQQKRENETDKAHVIRKWMNRIQVAITSGFIILVLIHYLK